VKVPSLILAADHRARAVVTIEPYEDYLGALSAAMTHCDGILASAQPLGDLIQRRAVEARHATYLSLNRTGLAGSVFELDDRLVASVQRAAADGLTGIKLMTRIDLADPLTSPALELLGAVVEESKTLGLEALIEAVVWREGAMARDPDSIVLAAVVAHDLGSPYLKVPVPEVAPGSVRREAVHRVVTSVGVPVLFLGGPHRADDAAAVLDEVRDCMGAGAAGMAMGRALYQDPAPAAMAKAVADIIHGR
jgi:DhnA family fructose-bisphosphate aldolase class Ia